MKKLQRIPITIVKTNVLVIFDVYITDGVKTALSTHGVGSETFHALEQLRGVIRALQTSMMVFLTKIVSNVILKTVTVLAKRLIDHA